jgi:cytochrome b subunit of formate dehydrogenase
MKRTSDNNDDEVVRFGLHDRIEHLLVMVIFFALALTGLPQKFHAAAISKAIVSALGGIAQVRYLHRMSGVLFSAMTLVHLVSVLAAVIAGRSSLAMVPGAKDFRDVVTTLRYYLRISDVRAQFDRFDYKEKFEYWGILFGGLIMITTGFALLYPIEATRFLPGQIIPAAKVAHGNEGLMAFLVVILWHIYNVVFAPEVFPGSKTIFTGKIPRERMRHEHPLEYARMFPEAADEVLGHNADDPAHKHAAEPARKPARKKDG